MRWLYHRWLRSLVALVLAWVEVVACAICWMWCGCPGRIVDAAAIPVCHLPEERVLQVPHGAWYQAEEYVESSVPVVRVKSVAPGQYELLYWGNPVRPRYSYRVLNIMSGDSVLLSVDGRPEARRELPVTRPRREDGRLPLQPVLKIGDLPPSLGGFCAVRVEVLDPDSGVVLCWAEYLLECPATH